MIVDRLEGNNITMELENGNKIIIGEDCLLKNTRIIFKGRNNILKMGGGRCHVLDSTIEFNDFEIPLNDYFWVKEYEDPEHHHHCL